MSTVDTTQTEAMCLADNSPYRLYVHGVLRESRANGPGVRAVIWVQGCTLACPGCFNPYTHGPRQGQRWNVSALARLLTSNRRIEGITLSGGEPLQQFSPVLALTKLLRSQSNLSVVLLSGYTWEEIAVMPRSTELLKQIDVLIAGRYDARRRVADGLIGSANKTVHFLTKRYSPADFAGVVPAEIVIDRTGQIILTGIDPVRLGAVRNGQPVVGKQ